MWRILFIIAVPYFIFFILFPLFQNPDEQAHFEVIYWVSRGIYPHVPNDVTNVPHPGELQQYFYASTIQHPSVIPNYKKIASIKLLQQSMYPSTMENKFTAWSGQAYNPPLYYIFGSIFLLIAKIFHVSLLDQIYVVRLTSTLFYFTSVIFCYKFLTLLTKNKYLANCILLIFALNPLVIQSGVGISPDIAALCFAIFFFYYALYFQKKLTALPILLLGTIATLASLAKLTGIVLVPAYIAYIYLSYRNKKSAFRKCILFLLSYIALQLPWLIFTYARYHSLVMATPAFGLREKSSSFMSVPAAFLQTLWGFRHIFMHYTGFIGWNEAFPPGIIFIPLTIIFIILSIAGIIIAWNKKNPVNKLLVLSVGFLFLFFFCLDFLRKLYYHPGWEIGGRNALPIFLPLIIFSTYSLNFLFRKDVKLNSIYYIYFQLLYFFYVLFFILLPRYY